MDTIEKYLNPSSYIDCTKIPGLLTAYSRLKLQPDFKEFLNILFTEYCPCTQLNNSVEGTDKTELDITEFLKLIKKLERNIS